METHDPDFVAPDRPGIWRALDASANRAAEALRVIEDVVRFGRDNAALAGLTKALRHELAAALARDDLRPRVAARDVAGDVGFGLTAAAALPRRDAAGLVAANLARAKQALRSLEECAAVVAPAAAAGFERIRYRCYELERAVLAALDARERLAGVGVCVLVDGRRDEREFERLVAELCGAGVGLIQLRDKELPLRALADRTRRALAIARRHDPARPPLVVVNDRPDLAVAVGADGVHVGADDLPVMLVRRVFGPRGLVGATAHSVAEAREAAAAGADYLGIGPCFPSATKAFGEHAPPEFIRTVCQDEPLPVFAIGGVSLERLEPLVALGVRRVAVASAVVRAASPGRAARDLIERLARLSPPPAPPAAP